MRIGSVRSASAAGRAASADQGFVHDFADGAQATTALRAAAETAMNVYSRTRRGAGDGATHFLIAQHIARTDDHRLLSSPGNSETPF
jgi:hypothetical protein